jgi:hypothetical protein
MEGDSRQKGRSFISSIYTIVRNYFGGLSTTSTMEHGRLLEANSCRAFNMFTNFMQSEISLWS